MSNPLVESSACAATSSLLLRGVHLLRWPALSLVALSLVGCASAKEGEGDETQELSLPLTTGPVEANLSLQTDWGAGFCADVTVTNHGSETLLSWAVSLDFADSQVTSLWGGVRDGNRITPVAYNSSVAPGASVAFGFCADAATAARPSITAVGYSDGSVDTGGGTVGNASIQVVNDWGSGYCAEVSVEDAISWTVVLDTHASSIYTVWNGEAAGSTGEVSVKGTGPGFGFCANTTADSDNHATIVSTTEFGDGGGDDGDPTTSLGGANVQRHAPAESLDPREWLVSSSSRDRFFFRVEGNTQGVFKGEAPIESREDWIVGLAFDAAIHALTDEGTGRVSGAAEYGAFSLIKAWGPASPQFLQAWATNEVLPEVTLEFQRVTQDGSLEVYRTIRLIDATVTRWQGAAGEQLAPKDRFGRELERISFTYRRIEWEDVSRK